MPSNNQSESNSPSSSPGDKGNLGRSQSAGLYYIFSCNSDV